MKNKLLLFATAVALLALPKVNFGQAPVLGEAGNFVVFSTNGAVTNTGISNYIGNVGADIGAVTGFGNINGEIHSGDSVTAKAASDLLIAYTFLNSAPATFFPASSLGNGDTLLAGVYSIGTAATLNDTLILDAKGNTEAVFIFQINGTFNISDNSKVILINGAQACNVFWKTEGAVTMGTGVFMRGTIVANNSAINMSAGDTLEGRALSTGDAINLNSIEAYIPIGCGRELSEGPTAPPLAQVLCYALFSSDGNLINVGTTNVTGDVGTNGGTTAGFDSALVDGEIHENPDGSTNSTSAHLKTVYDYLNTLPYDIKLNFPAQFGNNLILTPNTYLLDGATTFTDTLYLDAQGNSDAVFVFQINGAFSTNEKSNVMLINGTQAKNVFWHIEGAVAIDDSSKFRGTIVSGGAIELQTGVQLSGRALTILGAVNTFAMDAHMTAGCGIEDSPMVVNDPNSQTVCAGDSVSFTVKAIGTGLTYQWKKGTVNLIDGGNISGATDDTLTFNPVNASDSASNYYVVVTGATDPSDSSDYFSLIVNTAPVITSQPINQKACNGGSAIFTVAATGSNLTYQWRKEAVPLVNAGNISGANSSTLTINPVGISDTASNYNVIITGSCSPADTSNNVSLMYNAEPVITSQPANKTACNGSSASFTVTASGTGLTYQWRRGAVPLVNAANISGANSSTLTINPVSFADTATNYNVVITDTCSSSAVTSNNASLTVDSLPVITSQPANKVVCAGSAVNLSVTATGTNLTYQWRKGTANLFNGGNINGATSPTLTINPANTSDAATNYNVVVTGKCTTVTSSNVSITVSTSPTITSQPVDQTECNGGSASFTVTATGSDLTYQWRKGTVVLTDGGNTSGVNTATLTINPVSSTNAATNYNVVVTGTCAPSVTSVNVTLSTCTGIEVASKNANINIYPNPFSSNATITIDAAQLKNTELRMYNVLGEEVMNVNITTELTTLETGNLPSGIYFYKVIGNGNIIKSGKLVSQK